MEALLRTRLKNSQNKKGTHLVALAKLDHLLTTPPKSGRTSTPNPKSTSVTKDFSVNTLQVPEREGHDLLGSTSRFDSPDLNEVAHSGHRSVPTRKGEN